ncbi:MAG: hypothetical protein ACFE8P_11240 [Promethearchaeota archaeon]
MPLKIIGPFLVTDEMTLFGKSTIFINETAIFYRINDHQMVWSIESRDALR